AYLPHSTVDTWVRDVHGQLKEMNMTLDEAKQRLPERVAAMESWLLDGEQAIQQRNLSWLEQERQNWEVLFNQIESSPLNVSQQHAVLLNDDHNLVLAGAGSGKTSVLTARVAYLLQSHQATDEQMLLLAFGRDAAQELKQRLVDKIGLAAQNTSVSTFHQLGLSIIHQVESKPVEISPIA
ncbi:UvrD-helicase domain-containing protein, partial [Vibrio vulnificus]